MNLLECGWECYAPSQLPDASFARVASASRERFLVWTERGEVPATISGTLRHHSADWPCVGDWVVLRAGNVITEILPRRTQLSRKQPGKEVREQVLAANIDVLFVVSGLDHDYNPRRLERYLVLAFESGARPVILLNKADLRPDGLDTVIALTQSHASGVSVFALSALTGSGMESLSAQLVEGQTAALIGSSGAGKSTIVNRLLGQNRQQTTAVREADGKGRHTTTRRELILIQGGFLLMDLPGLRELQLWADPEQIDNTFAEVAALAEQCRFRDCTHINEPGCAVRDAGIDAERLDSYHKLQREVAFLDRQMDANLARETKRKWKAITKDLRRHTKWRY